MLTFCMYSLLARPNINVNRDPILNPTLTEPSFPVQLSARPKKEIECLGLDFAVQ